MWSVGNVTQFVLNKSRRNRIEVQRFRQWKNKGNRAIFQYNSNDYCPKVYPPSVWRSVFGRAREREKEPLRFGTNVTDLASLSRQVSRGEDHRGGVEIGKKMGYPGAQVARYLGVTNSCVTRAASAKEGPERQRYIP
jgi:hypothetical protein